MEKFVNSTENPNGEKKHHLKMEYQTMGYLSEHLENFTLEDMKDILRVFKDPIDGPIKRVSAITFSLDVLQPIEFRITKDEMLCMVNEKLQSWCLNLISDEELARAYRRPRKKMLGQLSDRQKFCLTLLGLLGSLFIAVVTILAFYHLWSQWEKYALELARREVEFELPLAFTEGEIWLQPMHDTFSGTRVIVSVRTPSLFSSYAYNSETGELIGNTTFSFLSNETCFMVMGNSEREALFEEGKLKGGWTCCETYCVHWTTALDKYRKLRSSTRETIDFWNITADAQIMETLETPFRNETKLLLRGRDENFVFDLDTGRVVDILSGGKKGANLIAFASHDRTGLFIVRDFRTAFKQFCKGDKYNVTYVLQYCVPINLPPLPLKKSEWERVKLLYVSRHSFVVAVSWTERHRINWSFRLYVIEKEPTVVSLVADSGVWSAYNSPRSTDVTFQLVDYHRFVEVCVIEQPQIDHRRIVLKRYLFTLPSVPL